MCEYFTETRGDKGFYTSLPRIGRGAELEHRRMEKDSDEACLPILKKNIPVPNDSCLYDS